jgi:hypothetical protein
MADSYLDNQFRKPWTPGKSLPRISTQLDSVRSYQFEVKFYGVPGVTLLGRVAQGIGLPADSTKVLSTAAKQVSPIGGSVDDIVVDRLNDKVYYPGKFTPEEVTITFDNQLLTKSTPALWEWFKTIYNPITGDATKNSPPGGTGFLGFGAGKDFKANKLEILELDNTNSPHSYITVYGVYPKTVRFSEKNYGSNDFSTIEVTFRFDFMDYYPNNAKGGLV